MHIQLKALLALVSLPLLFMAAAYVQWGAVGLPELASNFVPSTEMAAEPHGFPPWLRISHYVNLFFMIMLIRSGLQILMDHPRLYWNVHCTPGTEWLRLTPAEVPKDRIWTAKGEGKQHPGRSQSEQRVIVVLYRWRRAPRQSLLPTERVTGAVRAGLRYLYFAPQLRAVLVRTLAFVACGSARSGRG